MKNVVEILEQEHLVIQKVVRLMTHLASEIESDREIEPGCLQGIVQFMRIFGGWCHHGKEERALFSLLEAKGVPANGCPLSALVGEHRKAHLLLDQLETASAKYKAGADDGAQSAVLEPLRALIELYPQHIWKEEYLLFPMANKVLNAADQELLLKQFEAVESEIGLDVHHALEAMVGSMDRLDETLLSSRGNASPVGECSVCGS